VKHGGAGGGGGGDGGGLQGLPTPAHPIQPNPTQHKSINFI